MLRVIVLLLALVCATAFTFNRASTRLGQTSVRAGIKVIIEEDEPIENAMKRFKRAVRSSGHLMELRHRDHWESAADRKKRKAESARQLSKMERVNDRFERQQLGLGDYQS